MDKKPVFYEGSNATKNVIRLFQAQGRWNFGNTNPFDDDGKSRDTRNPNEDKGVVQEQPQELSPNNHEGVQEQPLGVSPNNQNSEHGCSGTTKKVFRDTRQPSQRARNAANKGAVYNNTVLDSWKTADREDVILYARNFLKLHGEELAAILREAPKDRQRIYDWLEDTAVKIRRAADKNESFPRKPHLAWARWHFSCDPKRVAEDSRVGTFKEFQKATADKRKHELQLRSKKDASQGSRGSGRRETKDSPNNARTGPENGMLEALAKDFVNRDHQEQNHGRDLLKGSKHWYDCVQTWINQGRPSIGTTGFETYASFLGRAESALIQYDVVQKQKVARQLE
ncbi:hypothetical protein OAU50_02240 [Planctomycetota bacterium]|nr:hypothetical protein [Planctomycetota bacterium]